MRRRAAELWGFANLIFLNHFELCKALDEVNKGALNEKDMTTR